MQDKEIYNIAVKSKEENNVLDIFLAFFKARNGLLKYKKEYLPLCPPDPSNTKTRSNSWIGFCLPIKSIWGNFVEIILLIIAGKSNQWIFLWSVYFYVVGNKLATNFIILLSLIYRKEVKENRSLVNEKNTCFPNLVDLI